MIGPGQRHNSSNRRSSGFVLFAIIVVLVIGSTLFFLYNRRQTIQEQGRDFARQVIQRCAFEHDVKYLHSIVAGERRLSISPGKDDEFIEVLTRLGVPDSSYSVSGEIKFENQFFSPHGTYKSILRFPDRAGTFYVAVAFPGATGWSQTMASFGNDQRNRREGKCLFLNAAELPNHRCRARS